MSYSGLNDVSTPSLSHSDLIGVSRSNKFAALSNLDIRVKPEYDNIVVNALSKPDNDSVCAGRSMVEMLGVLAIIGVLSVGAISGYSKAMFKYKLNKQSEQLSTIINASIRYYNDLRLISSEGVYNLIPILDKLGEIPKEMIVQNNNRILKDVFDTTINIYYHNTNYLGIIHYIDKSKRSVEICRNIIITAKENHADISEIFFRNDYSDKQEYSRHISGDKICGPANVCLKDMTVKQIDDACSFCASDRCLLYITIR